MRSILIANAKGGCGKSTLATNLAAYYAAEGFDTGLADFDPQGSSLAWLAERPADHEPIRGINGVESGLRTAPHNLDYLIMDAPAGASGHDLAELVKRAESIIVPILPSPVDINAARGFVTELLHLTKIIKKKARVALVANRIRDNTLIFAELDQWLTEVKAPYVASFREAQNYIRAYQRGIGVHELPAHLAWQDWEQWEPLLEWLESRRSRARA